MADEQVSVAEEMGLNEALVNRINELKSPLPRPITHGQFNRRLFLEAFFVKSGPGSSISPEDIMEYGAITEREFPVILQEYLDEGVIVKAPNLFGAELYKLNMTVKSN